jgi:tetratricopeptide (TPR) repeat protein
MEHRDLLGSPPATELPEDDEAAAALQAGSPAEAAASFPSYCAAWAALAEAALARGDAVTAYAYARTGYHRGLDQLRRAGWRGTGPVPWEHEPNRGFLRSLHLLGRAAEAIGEYDEADRCAQFLHDSSPTAAQELAG